MEVFFAEYFSALIAVVAINLALAGDNAIVIAIAAHNLPMHLQKHAVIWGTFGAVAVRVVMTLFVVWLLQIPGLLLAGGLLLIWIAYALLSPAKIKRDTGVGAATIWDAVKIIIIADTVMGFDNVLGVAGAAHDSFALVIIGLLISVPIVIWGSTLILRWLDRFPGLIYIGAGVLAWASAEMITDDPLLEKYFVRMPIAASATYVLAIGGVLLAGYIVNLRKKNRKLE